jgi:hypothetical protein
LASSSGGTFSASGHTIRVTPRIFRSAAPRITGARRPATARVVIECVTGPPAMSDDVTVYRRPGSRDDAAAPRQRSSRGLPAGVRSGRRVRRRGLQSWPGARRMVLAGPPPGTRQPDTSPDQGRFAALVIHHDPQQGVSLTYLPVRHYERGAPLPRVAVRVWEGDADNVLLLKARHIPCSRPHCFTFRTLRTDHPRHRSLRASG